MSNSTEHVVTFLVVGGVFGVGRLATRLNELLTTDRIGPWHIGQWIDFRHTAIRIKFGTAADATVAKGAFIESASFPQVRFMSIPDDRSKPTPADASEN